MIRRAGSPRAPGATRGAPAAPRSLLRFAHRGASTRAPENTLAAFEAAVRLGIDVVEFDVHLSADGTPVVIHDDRVDRTTDGRGAVGALTFKALRRLDAGAWFDPRFRGERIPSLDEALDWAGGRAGLNVELKTGAAPLARAVARSLARSRFRGFLLVSSFESEDLRRARAALPKTDLGFLASRSARGLGPLHRQVGLRAFHPHHRIATARRLEAAHRLGLAAYVWPVNALPLMRRLVDRGADGIMSDDPALFRSLAGR